MAREDWTEDVQDEREVRTAHDRVTETAFDNPDADAAERAADAGVSRAAYIDYAEALEAHQSREDIETLADRRAREVGADFEAGAFMRAPAGNTRPTSGSVDGVAPGSADAGAGDAGGDAGGGAGGGDEE